MLIYYYKFSLVYTLTLASTLFLLAHIHIQLIVDLVEPTVGATHLHEY
jgi:hypothetical protein